MRGDSMPLAQYPHDTVRIECPCGLAGRYRPDVLIERFGADIACSLKRALRA
jgi:hypothetical protein